MGKQVKDNMEASSIETAKNSLRSAGYTVLEIKELNALNRDIELPFLGNPKPKDMAISCVLWNVFRMCLRWQKPKKMRL